LKNILIITNNKMVQEQLKNEGTIEFIDCIGYHDVLVKVRDMVHGGHRILTHPLSGSIKPNETPFKTVVVTKKPEGFDSQSLLIIEDSIDTYNKFASMNKIPYWPQDILEDFMLIDYTIIKNAIDNILYII
jgi:hypothetical protein